MMVGAIGFVLATRARRVRLDRPDARPAGHRCSAGLSGAGFARRGRILFDSESVVGLSFGLGGLAGGTAACFISFCLVRRGAS